MQVLFSNFINNTILLIHYNKIFFVKKCSNNLNMTMGTCCIYDKIKFIKCINLRLSLIIPLTTKTNNMLQSKLLKNTAKLFISLSSIAFIISINSCTNGENTKDKKVDSTTPTMSDTTVKKMDSTMKKNGMLKDSIPDSTHKTEQAPPPKH